jgi:phosphate transport system substrate-binding protein
MIKYILLTALTFVFGINHTVAARDEIRIVGSPEVLPYFLKVAQNFTLISEFAAPSMEVTGTGNGFRLLCGGIGFEYPDINATSRRMTDAEFEICRSNGVNHIVEIAVGLGAIVMANSKAAKQYNFKTSQLFQAVSAGALNDGQIVKNTVRTWQEIDPALPNEEIRLMGPPPASGTYYEFTSEHAIGPDGYLADKGFIPLDDRGRNSARDAALSLAPIAW